MSKLPSTTAFGTDTTFSKSTSKACNDNSRPSVFWRFGQGPYENTIEALANIDLTPAKNKRVLLKPNIGRNAKPETGVTTHPQVVAAAIDAFRKAGADVSVGESPITGVKTLEAFESCGITAIAEERNCPLIDMDARPFVEVEIADGIAINKLKVCPEVLEFDIVVSIPVMKTHMHTGVTLAVKNMKGCLWRRSKVSLHMLSPLPGYDEKPLDIAIADMSSVLRPHLSIIDGTVCMEGLGPSAGKPRELGVVIVGADPFAADAVACDMMGISAADIPHLRMGSRHGGVIDLDAIDICPPDYKDIKQSFVLPPDKLSIEFEGFKILDEKSCSACQSTLLLFLKKNAKKLRETVADDKEIVVAIGKGHDQLPDGTICVGNCTCKHKDRHTFVPGCPPVASEILNEYFASLDTEA